MTGWRLGFGVMPSALAEKVTRLQINCTSCAPPFTQRAALAALTGPRDEVRAMVATFKRRRDLIVAGLDGLPGFSCARPAGAFYVFPRAPDAERLADRLLEEAGVACLAGTAFGAAGAGFLRFSYATSEDVIEEALERMRRFLA
jgi:aspartate/methionine/tyrosine aminotransferase